VYLLQPKFIRNYVYLLQAKSLVAKLTTLPHVTECIRLNEICSSRKFYSLMLPIIHVPFYFLCLLRTPFHELSNFYFKFHIIPGLFVIL